MSTLDKITSALTAADAAATSILTLTDRVAGAVGRGGPRWHRWRSTRLRLRALTAWRRGRLVRARELLAKAGVHLAHAVRLENLQNKALWSVPERATRTPEDERTLLTLLSGREPLLAEGNT